MTDERIERLRERGRDFAQAVTQLESYRASARLDPKAASVLGKLLHEAQGIRAAVRAATQTLDGAKRWVSRTFQTDAMEAVPFAPEIVANTAAGATAMIEHFLDKIAPGIPVFERLKVKYEAMNEKERAGLGELAALPVAGAVAIKPALILLAVLAGIIWWGNRNFGTEGD